MTDTRRDTARELPRRRRRGVGHPARRRPDVQIADSASSARSDLRTMLTWGLHLSRQGTRVGHPCVAPRRTCRPSAEYVIAGATHPKVLAHRASAIASPSPRLVAELRSRRDRQLDDRTSTRPSSPRCVGAADACCSPTTRATRRPRACSSRRSPPGFRSSRPASRTRVELLARRRGHRSCAHDDPACDGRRARDDPADRRPASSDAPTSATARTAGVVMAARRERLPLRWRGGMRRGARRRDRRRLIAVSPTSRRCPTSTGCSSTRCSTRPAASTATASTMSRARSSSLVREPDRRPYCAR